MTTLYQKLGGQAALEGAVFIFYEKMLQDPRVAHYFEGVNIATQRQKMIDMMAFAFGDVSRVMGVDLRASHAALHLSEEDFDITLHHVEETFDELNVPEALKIEAMAIIASTKNAVLNR